MERNFKDCVNDIKPVNIGTVESQLSKRMKLHAVFPEDHRIMKKEREKKSTQSKGWTSPYCLQCRREDNQEMHTGFPGKRKVLM